MSNTAQRIPIRHPTGCDRNQASGVPSPESSIPTRSTSPRPTSSSHMHAGISFHRVLLPRMCFLNSRLWRTPPHSWWIPTRPGRSRAPPHFRRATYPQAGAVERPRPGRPVNRRRCLHGGVDKSRPDRQQVLDPVAVIGFDCPVQVLSTKHGLLRSAECSTIRLPRMVARLSRPVECCAVLAG